jgi:hypothetical protein
VRPIARLATELAVTGAGQVAVGVAGLAVGLATEDAGVGRALVPFAVAFAVVAAVSGYASRWLRDAEPAGAAAGTRVETTALTVRRSLVGLVVALLAVGVAAVIGGGLAAVLGGVVAAVGAVDLANMRWVRRREAETGALIFRELGSSPFSGGRRPLYTRPTKDITLAT